MKNKKNTVLESLVCLNKQRNANNKYYIIDRH